MSAPMSKFAMRPLTEKDIRRYKRNHAFYKLQKINDPYIGLYIKVVWNIPASMWDHTRRDLDYAGYCHQVDEDGGLVFVSLRTIQRRRRAARISSVVAKEAVSLLDEMEIAQAIMEELG